MSERTQKMSDAGDAALESLRDSLNRIRTGRASTTLVDSIVVMYFGAPTPIQQLATISIPDPTSIAIQPWDKSALGDIEKAILASPLGLSPINDGKYVRLTLPPLSQERRAELVKLVKHHGEEARVALRRAREEILQHVKSEKNNGDISEDDMFRAKDEVDAVVETYNEKIKTQVEAKEHEVMNV